MVSEDRGRPSPSRAARFAMRAALGYAVFGAAWIVLSDRVLDATTSGALEDALATAKGLMYVAISAVLVFVAVRRYSGISERAEREVRASEEAFRRSEERYRSLVERVPGVVYLNEIAPDDPSFTSCIYIGPQLTDLLGYAPQEWIDDPDLWLRVVHPDDLDAVRAANDAADASGEFSTEFRMIHRGGDVVWIHDQALRVAGDDGRPLYWQGLMVDMTAQRVADAAVHGLTESLRGVFAASPLPIIVMDPQDVVRHWNPAAERVFGWSAGEVIGRPLPIVPDDALNAFEAVGQRVRAGEAVTGVPAERLTKVGGRVSVSISAAPLRDADGAVEATVAVLEDVTAQRRAAAELEQRAEMLDNVSDAVIATDGDYRVVYWNRGAERLYGWTRSETLGRSVGEFVRLAVEPDRFQQIQGAFEADGLWRGEVNHRVRDGRLVPVDSLTVARALDDGGRYIVSVNRDVSERASADAALERRTRQQEAVASLGLAALASEDLDGVLREAAQVAAETLGVPLAAVMELSPDRRRFLLRSGVGWHDGVVGEYHVDAESASLAAYALHAEEAVIIDDLRHDWRFPPPTLLLEHDVVSGAAVVVFGAGEPFGVIEALATEARAFSRDDVRFLRGVAAIAGLAIERSRADVALEEAEARYRGLVERGPGVVYLHDTTSTPSEVTYVSPQVEAMFGYPPSAWTDDPTFWVHATHVEDRERLIRADRRATETGDELDIEYRLVAADGRDVWVHDHSTVISDQAGNPLFRQGLVVDVSDRHRAEDERARALERQFQLATRLELLHQIDREIRAAATVEELCERALQRLRALLRSDFASIGVFDPVTGLLDFPTMIHDDEMRTPEPRPSEPDPEALAMLREEFLRIDDLDEVRSESPYVLGAQGQGLRAVMSFAMYAGEEHIGALIVGSREPAAFGEEAEDIGREVASSLAIAIRQQHLRDALSDRADQLERLAQERQQMLRRIVRAQEEERERVALELHDGLGQILTSISLFASDLEDEVPEASRSRAARVNELVRRAIADSRQLVWSLRPPELERLGLIPALRRLAEEASAGEITVDLHDAIGDLRLGQDEEAVVYRVVQEAVHNAQKHAKASAISILLRRTNGNVSTIVEDNGCGFDPATVAPGRGLGLIGMRERAELVDGHVVVESAAGAGTRLRLEVPIEAVP